ncbi:hypothetical protein ACFOG5_23605 [Pedobacter fastidiosus]|uniref:Uncharacterized protein n=1 Tax=Pedobacter fastidiosus TaxID=2765361 RepID=A0ABR7KXD8_9SPHI|nr:hypothetical protein [Pedobacter fastidiosus]MBC6112781.1 hypothetical protein [Pedobacter fastidiosus]
MEKGEFIDFLKRSKAKVSSVHHVKKGNPAYQELRDIEREVRYQCVNCYQLTWDEFKTGGHARDLQLSSLVLERYTASKNSKRNTAMALGN